ncbi:MAG: hypothetical protein R3E83_11435 [Burkholderiaceae bacterium]
MIWLALPLALVLTAGQAAIDPYYFPEGRLATRAMDTLNLSIHAIAFASMLAAADRLAKPCPGASGSRSRRRSSAACSWRR